MFISYWECWCKLNKPFIFGLIFNFLKNYLNKCFGICGCGYNGTCNYCNSNYFIGYDGQNTHYTLFQNASSSGAPNSNGNTCTLASQAVDVIQ